MLPAFSPFFQTKNTQKFQTVKVLASSLHLLPYFPSLYVSPCVTTLTDSSSALLRSSSLPCVHSSLLCLLLNHAPTLVRLNLSIRSQIPLDNNFVFAYGIWVMFYALSLWKTSPQHDHGGKVNTKKTYEMGGYILRMGDMKIHTKYWSEELKRTYQLWKYSLKLENNVQIYFEMKECTTGSSVA
jgi:hypothetical protein